MLKDCCAQTLVTTLLAALLIMSVTKPASSADVVADLSKRLVPITTGFSGTDVLLFGAIDPKDNQDKEVIVTIKGPADSVRLRKKEKIAGVWINSNSALFTNAPGFYAAFASHPLEEIASPLELEGSEIGIENLPLHTARKRFSPNLEAEWQQALVRNMSAAGLYKSEVGTVTMLSDQLFRTELHLPANVPTGTYTVSFYTVKDQRVVGAQSMPLIVRKAGIGAWLYDFAHRSPALYGIICVIIAIVAGYASYIAFRRS